MVEYRAFVLCSLLCSHFSRCHAAFFPKTAERALLYIPKRQRGRLFLFFFFFFNMIFENPSATACSTAWDECELNTFGDFFSLSVESVMITKAALQVGSWTRWWSTYHLLVSGQCSLVVAGWTKTRMMGNWRENCYLEQTLKRRIHHVRTHREWFCCHAVIGSNISLYPLNQSELIIVLAVLLINQLICLHERKKILFKTCLRLLAF